MVKWHLMKIQFLQKGVSLLPGLLQTLRAVRLQRHVLLHQGLPFISCCWQQSLCNIPHQGWQLWGYTEDQEELPVLQIQVSRNFYANTFLRIYVRSHINFFWNYFTTIWIFDGISAAKRSWAHNVLTSNLLSWLNTLRTWGQLGIRTVEYWFCLDEQDFTKRKTLES